MRRILAVCLALSALPLPAAAGEDDPKLMLKNEASRVVHCALVVDGRLFTDLTFKPGQEWSRGFSPGRDLKLVCQRLGKPVYGPLEPGVSYSFVDGKRRVELRGAGAAGS